jgi:hypothetical protein
MKSYKLNIKVIIAAVGVMSLFIFSALLVLTKNAELESLGEILLHYGLIIAPISILWALAGPLFMAYKVISGNA